MDIQTPQTAVLKHPIFNSVYLYEHACVLCVCLCFFVCMFVFVYEHACVLCVVCVCVCVCMYVYVCVFVHRCKL